MTGTTGGATTAAARTGSLSTRLSFFFPRTRRERRPADTAAFPVCTAPPYYGVIFLREERPLTPEVLTHWAETLSQPLFGQPFSCTLAQVPSRQEAMERLENETRLTR